MALSTAQSKNLQPELIEKFNRVIAACTRGGVKVVIHSTYRSTARQTALYNNRHKNPNPVAKPGFSPHEWGVAIDATPLPRTPAGWAVLYAAARKEGLHLGVDFARQDPPHFELMGFNHGKTIQKWPKPSSCAPPFKPYPGNVAAQPLLIKLKLLTAAQAAGGDGPLTRAAVKKFQILHNLNADGLAGPKTTAALKAAIK